MDLFENIIEEPISIINKHGDVDYYGVVIGQKKSDTYFRQLLNSIEWKHDEVVIYGKKITTKRKVAWYGDKPFEYTYSNTHKIALPWTKILLELKDIVEEQSNESYNACLLNLYHDGQEGMSWHSDDEIALKREAAIASLSLGAERKFSFKHKQTKDNVSLTLRHGSLLVMKGETQSHWLHRLPPTKTVHGLRVNLTFRTICGQ